MSNYRSFVFRLTDRMRLAIVVVTVVILVCLVAAFMLVYRLGQGSAAGLYEQNVKLTENLREVQLAFAGETAQLAMLHKQAEVDRLVLESVRQEIVEQQREIAELQSDIAFYRGLMAPGEDKKQPGIHDFKVRFDQADNKYYYTLVFKQSGLGKKYLKGQTEIFILLDASSADGSPSEPVRQSLSALPDHSGEFPVKLNFRFFQKIQGTFRLPDGAGVSAIEIDFSFQGKAGLSSPMRYSWQDLL